jgi:hypothetical protein
MSRGGRGGGRGGGSAASRLNSGALPFEIDKELEDEFSKLASESNSSFPVCPVLMAYLPQAAPTIGLRA